MDPRVLKTCVCSVGEGQQCGLSASVIKTAGPASVGRRVWAPAALKVMLAWIFFFLIRKAKISEYAYS